MKNWDHCKNILCIRADNMGDLIMTSPAIRALKETFDCRITLLTSHAGAVITSHLENVDEVIVYDLPWVKANSSGSDLSLLSLTEKIRSYEFDAVVIFTVYSQSALPAAMLAYMAGIPRRLAYSRENPYELLTDWVPDHEPYHHISHQVERDLALVAQIGAAPLSNLLQVTFTNKNWNSASQKILQNGCCASRSWIILHPGVSEEKRKYPVNYWIRIGQILTKKYQTSLIITGSKSENSLSDAIAHGIGRNAFSMAGLFSIGEFIAIIANAKCVVSVNTSTIHIAAATQTPVVVLYAQTNPQHTPWKSRHKLLPFSVDENLRSNNTIIRHVNDKLYKEFIPYPLPQEVAAAVEEIISSEHIQNAPSKNAEFSVA